MDPASLSSVLFFLPSPSLFSPSSVRWAPPVASATPHFSPLPGHHHPAPLPLGKQTKKSQQETYSLCAMQTRHLSHSPVTMVTLGVLSPEERAVATASEGSEPPAKPTPRSCQRGTAPTRRYCWSKVRVCLYVWVCGRRVQLCIIYIDHIYYISLSLLWSGTGRGATPVLPSAPLLRL